MLLSALMLTACFNLSRLSLYNLSKLYSNTSFTELNVVAFNFMEGKARVFIPVHFADMVVAENEESGASYYKIEISYELFETYESKNILDSASIIITDSTLHVYDTTVAVDIDYPGSKKYTLKISLSDLNRVDAVTAFLFLDNSSRYSHDNFILRDPDGEIIYRTYFSKTDEFILATNEENLAKLPVRYYKRDFPLALPPFLEDMEASFNYLADSVFDVKLIHGQTELLNFEEEGFYHFQKDSNQRAGYTLFRFYPGFPEITNTEQMMQPLRYITTKAEYNEIAGADDRKLAVDNFWLENAGNPSRARSLIQKYYGRVVDANNYFTSYHEGWKTDRGLIYIVFGPPGIVYRGEKLEEWLYGEKGNSNSIRFQFVKVVNPFTENDYSLIKSPSYKEKWYNIVNTWRR